MAKKPEISTVGIRYQLADIFLHHKTPAQLLHGLSNTTDYLNKLSESYTVTGLNKFNIERINDEHYRLTNRQGVVDITFHRLKYNLKVTMRNRAVDDVEIRDITANNLKDTFYRREIDTELIEALDKKSMHDSIVYLNNDFR